MSIRIPFKILPIGLEELTALADVIISKNLGMGKKVNEFEQMFAGYIGSKYAVAVDCCTSALFLSIIYNMNNAKYTIEIPSMTVPLVANTILHTNNKIKFVDECNWVGHSYQLNPFPIIDSAHKVERNQFKSYEDKILLCFSFYPTKPISSAEGGMICTNDSKANDWLRKARFYGRNDTNTVAKNSWEYDIDFAGWKMNMTEVQAAIGIEQLKKLDYLNFNRMKVINSYNKKFNLANNSLYLYRINVENRDEFIKYMYHNGVECGVHFKPLHLMKAFENCERYDLSNTENVGKKTVSLPLYDTLDEENQDYIIKLVQNWEYKNVVVSKREIN